MRENTLIEAIISTQIMLLNKHISKLKILPRISPSLKELISRRKRKTKRTAVLWIQNTVDLSMISVKRGLFPLYH